METVLSNTEMNTKNGNIFSVAQSEDIFPISWNCFHPKPGNKNIALKAKGKITMNADSGLEIKSPKDVKISGNNIASSAQSAYKVDAMSINQSASQGVNVKAGTELKAEGGVGAILKGGGTVKVEAGAMATVKGAMNQIG
jgi:hypothetical protein